MPSKKAKTMKNKPVEHNGKPVAWVENERLADGLVRLRFMGEGGNMLGEDIIKPTSVPWFVKSMRMPFGKHRGRPVEWVATYDRRYLEWFYMNVSNVPMEFIKHYTGPKKLDHDFRS